MAESKESFSCQLLLQCGVPLPPYHMGCLLQDALSTAPHWKASAASAREEVPGRALKSRHILLGRTGKTAALVGGVRGHQAPVGVCVWRGVDALAWPAVPGPHVVFCCSVSRGSCVL